MAPVVVSTLPPNSFSRFVDARARACAFEMRPSACSAAYVAMSLVYIPKYEIHKKRNES